MRSLRLLCAFPGRCKGRVSGSCEAHPLGSDLLLTRQSSGRQASRQGAIDRFPRAPATVGAHVRQLPEQGP